MSLILPITSNLSSIETYKNWTMCKLDMLLNLGDRPQTKYLGPGFFLDSLNSWSIDTKFGYLKEDLRMLMLSLSDGLIVLGVPTPCLVVQETGSALCCRACWQCTPNGDTGLQILSSQCYFKCLVSACKRTYHTRSIPGCSLVIRSLEFNVRRKSLVPGSSVCWGSSNSSLYKVCGNRWKQGMGVSLLVMSAV